MPDETLRTKVPQFLSISSAIILPVNLVAALFGMTFNQLPYWMYGMATG
jgi:Mg2+ and Co2+ transporter CorA